MSKRLFLSVLALLLLLSGCSSPLEGEYSSSRPHEYTSFQIKDEAEMTLEASDYGGIVGAVEELVANGVEHGVIRITGYSGDVEADLTQACMEVSTGTALGAYCVYFINYSLERLVAVYEASVSVMYRIRPDEVADIPQVDSESLGETVLDAILNRTATLTVRTQDPELGSDAVNGAVEGAYYGNPGKVLYIPTFTVTSYPEEGEDRILKIDLSYLYAASTVESRQVSLEMRTAVILDGIGGGTPEEKLWEIGEFFANNVEFNDTVNTSEAQARRYNAMTAYGALVQGSAVGEGYAMGLKVLCDSLGIECTVIRGRHNNMDHAWNLVRLSNGELYHVDMSSLGPEGPIFRNDGQQLFASYWWDPAKYPACQGESILPPAPPEDVPPEDGDGGDEGGEAPDAGETEDA